MYFYRAKFSWRPRRLVSGPYWAGWWLGVIVTNLNLDFCARLRQAIKDAA